MVIETPAKESDIEGCSFFVGPAGKERPSIFANSYKSTWFRRNRVLLHELAHAIFDVESVIASLDFESHAKAEDDILEKRADAFAQEALVPSNVLVHYLQRHGLKGEQLDAEGMAELVAENEHAVCPVNFARQLFAIQFCEQYQCERVNHIWRGIHKQIAEASE